MDKWRKWIVADVALILVSAQILHAQMGDPSAREDEAIERQKILKAADQIDLLVQQNQKLQEDLGKLQQQVTVLQDEKGALLRKCRQRQAVPFKRSGRHCGIQTIRDESSCSYICRIQARESTAHGQAGRL
jgi:hypothetical protein